MKEEEQIIHILESCVQRVRDISEMLERIKNIVVDLAERVETLEKERTA